MRRPSRANSGQALAASFALFALTGSADPDGVELRVHYAADSTVRVDEELAFELEIGVLTLVVEGERIPYSERRPFELEGEVHRTIVDRIERADDSGRPTELTRRFEAVVGSVGVSAPLQEVDGALAGHTLRLERDPRAASGCVATQDDDEEELAEHFLEGHRLDLPETRLLPEGPVEIGESWTVDAEALLDLVGLDADTTWFENPGAFSLDSVARVVACVEGEAEVRLAAREEGGARHRLEARFSLEARGEELTLSDLLGRAEGVDDSSGIEVWGRWDGELTLWLDADERRWIRTEHESTVDVQFVSSSSRDSRVELDVRMALTGRRHL